jgi:uncharacterized protein YciI
MPYIIQVTEKPGTRDIFDATLDSHRDYLQPHIHKMLATGALLEEDGSRAGGALIIIDTENRSEAEDYINNDPLTLAGIFESITITKWRKFIYNGEMMPQMEKF